MSKLSLKIKIMILVLIFFIGGIVGGVFYLSSKISPEEIRKVTLSTLQKTFPSSNFLLEGVDFSIGTSLKLNVNSFEMSLKDRKNENEVIKLKEAKVYIPLWSLITGGGAIEIDIDRPEIFFYNFGNETNFALAFKTSETNESGKEKSAIKPETENKEDDNSSGDKKLKIMNFFAKSTVNIKFTNILVNYKIEKDNKGKVEFSRFIIKNLNFVKSTAFELATTFEGVLKDGNKVSLKGLLIGDLNINEILQNKDIKSSLRLTLEDIKLSQLQTDLPTINSDIKFQMTKKDGAIQLNTSTDFSHIGNVKLNVFLKDQYVSVEGLNSNFAIKEVIKMFAPDIGMINAENSKFVLTGNVIVNRGKVNPKLEFTIKPGLSINLDKDLSSSTELKGEIAGKNIKLNSQTKFMKGIIDTNINTQFDINNPVVDISKIAPLNIDIDASDIVLADKWLNEKIYGNKENASSTEAAKDASKKEKGQGQSSNKDIPALLLPKVNLGVKWNRIMIGQETFSGSVHVLTKGSQVLSDDLKFRFSKGEGKLSFVLNFLKNAGQKLNMNFKLDNLNLISLKPFIPPQINAVTGSFTGRIKGDVLVYPEKLNHDLTFELVAKNGELKGIKIGDVLKDIANNFSFLKGKADNINKEVDNNFEILEVNGRATEEKYFFQKYKFIGVNKMVEINGSGVIYPEVVKKEGSLKVDLIDNTGKISNPLEQYAGTRIFPLLLKGYGFALKPDYMYTSKELAKGVAKKKQDELKVKAKEKARSSATKAIDSYIKDDNKKDKIKKALKGLF